jgi:hypothetical protein
MEEKGGCEEKFCIQLLKGKDSTCCSMQVGNCSSTLEASFANLNIKKFDGENILTLLTDT